MNNTAPTTELLTLVVIAVVTSIVALAMKKHATTPKHKLALVAPLVLVAAMPVVLLSISVDPRIAVLTLMGAITLMGLIWILTPVESSDLYSRLRNDGGVWRWIINETPKKESFVLRGWLLLLIGLGGFAMLLIQLSQSA